VASKPKKSPEALRRAPPIGPLFKEFQVAARCEGLGRWGLSADPAEDLDRVLDHFEKVLKAGHAETVKRLTERALETLDVQLNELDDPWDMLTMVVDRVEDLHYRACRKVRPDPEDLARWLWDWKHRSQFNFFFKAPEPYADVLGKKGLAIYASLRAESGGHRG